MANENTNTFKDDLKVTELKQYQDFYTQKTNDFIEQYTLGNSQDTKEYMCYLAAAIFLTYNELYPNLSKYIPFRTKGDASYIRNIVKELQNQLFNANSDSFDNFKNLFDDTQVINDINGLTIVLDHINPTKSKNVNYETDEIKDLYKKGSESLIFVKELDEILDSVFMSEKEYYDYKKQILKRTIELRFSEFDPERPVSYEEELENLEQIYDEKLKSNTFSMDASSRQIDELKILNEELRSILYDKTQYLILKETFPQVMKQPILADFLQVKTTFVKDSRKPNGFAATYYYLDTPFGKIEVQLQSNKRYYESKRGSAAHSSISGKDLNLDDLFELSNPNDKNPVSFYLEKLSKIPVNAIRLDIRKPKFNSSEDEIAFYSSEQGNLYKRSEKIKELQSHIKLKDNITYEMFDEETNQMKNISVPIDDVILSLAQIYSPQMNVCSSAHTNFSTVSVHHKNLISEFSEILRRKDSMTCTGDMVIHRLKQIVKDDLPYHGLPKELSKRDIINYAETKLNNKEENLRD